jgi:fucose permease
MDSCLRPVRTDRYKLCMQSNRTGLVLLLAYVGFVSLGLPDSVIGVAWPFIRRGFHLPLDALGPYFLCGVAGYFLASANSGKLVRRWGVGHVLSFSSLLTALCLLGYTVSPLWAMMVGLSFFTGLGAGAIDSGINTFAAVRFSPRHVNWLHACWGIGAATGPSWRWGYVVIMIVLAALTAGFFATSSLWKLDAAGASDAPHVSRRHTLALPAAWLSIGVFFVYCGTEASTGQWTYSLLVESRGISPVTAGLWISLYWGSLTVGRIVIGALANRIPPLLLLRLCMAGAALGSGLVGLRAGHGLEAFGLALTGFSLAAIFPTLISLTPRRFAPGHVANVVGFQIAGAGLGFAIIPAAIGAIANRTALEILPWLMIAGCVLMFLLHESLARKAAA